MNCKVFGSNNFSTKPLVAAVAMALFAPAVLADNGMPGAGLVVRNQGNITVNGVALPGGNQIIGLTNGATIATTVCCKGTVIQWGSPGVVDSANKAGFNVAAGKTLTFNGVGLSGFLNIDISGQLSTIAGTVIAGPGVDLAIANEKGITVASGAVITAPNGLSLVGANLNTIDAINAYDAAAQLQMSFAGSSPVAVMSGANLTGVGTYLLVAGSGSVNVSGKAPAGATVPIIVVGGVGSDFNTVSGTLTLNDMGTASTTVRSSAPADVTIGYGTVGTPFDASAAGHNLYVAANGNLTNTGVVEFGADGTVVTSHLQWTGALINSGTLQTTKAATGLDFDVEGTTVPWFNNTASTNPLYAKGGLNNSGTMTSKDGYLDIGVNGPITNGGTLNAGNGYLDLTTTAGAIDNSATVTGSSNIYVYAADGNVTNSGSMTADASDLFIWAGSNGKASNPHNIVNSGKLTSNKSYVSLQSEFGSITNTATGVITASDVYIYANYSTDGVFGSATNAGTINITSKGGNVEFFNYGTGDINVGGTVQATGTGNYIGYFSAAHSGNPVPGVTARGTTTISTPITVLADKTSEGIYLAGEKIVVTAPLTVSEATTGAGAGTITFWGSNGFGGNATTIGANLTAGGFYFYTNEGGELGGQPFDMSVALNGNLTTTAGGNRTVQMYDVSSVTGPGVITANHVVFDASGNVRNVTSNNYLLNGLRITTVGTAPVVEFTARSPAVQVINLAITGAATVSSGNTVVINDPCYTGLCFLPSGGYIPQSNAGSSLLVTATGNLTIGANDGPGTFIGGGQGGLSFTNGFLFPGGVAFVAGGALNVNTVVDNAFIGTAVPFQGVYFQGTTINALQPVYTNGNSFVNYSVRPNGGVGLSTTYQARAGTNFLGFPNLTAMINPNDSFLNTYTVLANAVANGQPWLPLVSFTPIHQ